MKRSVALVVALAVAGVALLEWRKASTPPTAKSAPPRAPLPTNIASAPAKAFIHDGGCIGEHSETSPTVGAIIDGDVVDHDDLGVANARIVLKSADGLRFAKSDSSGHFVASGLPTGRWRLVGVLADGFEALPLLLEFDVAPTLAVSGLRFTVHKGLPLEVRDREDHPVSGATVDALENRFGLRDSLGPLGASSSANGRLPITVLPGDVLVIHHVDFQDTAFEAATSPRDVAAARLDALAWGANVIRMDRRGSVLDLNVRVIDQGDAGVTDASFFVIGEQATDASYTRLESSSLPTVSLGDGRFSIRVPLPRPHTLSVRAFGLIYPFSAAAADQPIRVERPVSAVKGHVTLSGGGAVEAFAIELVGANRFRQMVFSWDGSFRLPAMPGSWTLIVSAPGLATARQTVVLDRAEDVVADVSLTKGRLLTGIVFDRQTGRPIEGALVSGRTGDVVFDGLPQNAQCQTKADGSFTIRGAPPEHFEIAATAAGYGTRSVPVDATATHLQIGLHQARQGISEWEGIGAVLDGCLERKRWCVGSFAPGAGAKSAGMLVGDEIVAVDGDPPGEDVKALLNRIRGPEGTMVRLTIRRGDATLDFTVVRRLLRQE
jgi:hypothetical protein